MPNIPLKLMLPEELVKRLEEGATKFGKRTPQAIVGEVVQDYLYLWEAAEEKRLKFVQAQIRAKKRSLARKKT